MSDFSVLNFFIIPESVKLPHTNSGSQPCPVRYFTEGQDGAQNFLEDVQNLNLNGRISSKTFYLLRMDI